MKHKQREKLQELRTALRREGLPLDAQAKRLGLGRSTTYALMTRHYKNSGISMRVMRRMLASPEVSDSVKRILIEYQLARAKGEYGHSKASCNRYRKWG